MELLSYRTEPGQCPHDDWRAHLDAVAGAPGDVALAKFENGNPGNTKPVGGGVPDYRIDLCPGYRLYFGRDGEVLVIMLADGDNETSMR